MDAPSEASDRGNRKLDCNGDGRQEADKLADGKKTLARTWSIPNSMCILSDTKTETPTVTELRSPKLKLPHLGDDTTERVFPVRSVVSFDASSPALLTPSLDKLEAPISPFADMSNNTVMADEETRDAKASPARYAKYQNLSRPNYLSLMRQQGKLTGLTSTTSVPTLGSPLSRNQATSSSQGSTPDNSSSSAEESSQPTLEQIIRDGGRVLDTSRPTQGLQYSRQDDDTVPIHSLGALVVVRQTGDNLAVQTASSNSKEILGYTPDELFELESICNILSSSQQNSFTENVRTVLDDDYDVELTGPEVFDLSISTSEGDRRLWCTMHTSEMYKNYVICEFEPHLAHYTEPANVHSFPERQDDVSSLEVLENLGQKYDTRLFNDLPRMLQRISSAQTLDSLVRHTISALRQLTSFHRVTVFHFDGDRNGIVVADVAEPSLGLESYKHVQFEESTFPDEIKRQYLRNTVCLSYQPHETTGELVYRASTNKLGLDVSHCYLPTAPALAEPHAEISVQACVSIGILVFGKLWGLISCQSLEKSVRLHPILQKAFWILSTTISSNIERLSYTLPFQLHTESLSESAITATEKSIKAPSGDLLGLFGGDYGAASISGETKILGKPVDSQEILALFEYLRAKNLDTVLWSTDIHSDFVDLDYSPGFRQLSGLLHIPLSADGSDFIVFFRCKNEIKQDEANPMTEENPKKDPVMANRHTEWSAAEFGKASILSLLYRTFTEIWQEKEAAMQNNQLMKLLLANTAHEFRTPLNAIINYLEIVLDENLNQETRENLSRSHSASKSLVYIINDLLDLTNAENGQSLIKDEVFSLSETLCEATSIFWEEARQKHVDLQVVQHSALPLVLGDQRRVRQVITNLISNALQHTSSGAVTIESCILSGSCQPGDIAVEVAIHDTGSGMSSETVETLFCELEQVSNKGYMQSPMCFGSGSNPQSGSERVLGLGLALVARIVLNMNGQLSLKSEQGKGSCFKIRLRFPLPSDGDNNDASQTNLSRDALPNRKGCDVHHSGDTQPGADSPFKQKDGDSQNAQDEEQTRESPKHACRSGDKDFPGGDPGPEESKFLEVDISLKSGESRSMSLPQTPSQERDTPQTQAQDQYQDADAQASQLHLLVAEDDPINSTIVKKRLEKFGHSVRLTTNGKECATVYRENPTCFDAVLMDLQV